MIRKKFFFIKDINVVRNVPILQTRVEPAVPYELEMGSNEKMLDDTRNKFINAENNTPANFVKKKDETLTTKLD